MILKFVIAIMVVVVSLGTRGVAPRPLLLRRYITIRVAESEYSVKPR